MWAELQDQLATEFLCRFDGWRKLNGLANMRRPIVTVKDRIGGQQFASHVANDWNLWRCKGDARWQI